MQYFDHSTSAATDSKIMQLRLECGGAAVDAYWYFVEQIHRDERPLCVGNATAMRVHCHTLCTDSETLENWILAMRNAGLIEYDETGENVTSPRAQENIDSYKAKREKASSAAKSRWDNADAKRPHKRTQCNRNANAMPTKQNNTTSSNAINSITTANETPAVAAAAKAAPTDEKKPFCPMCDTPVWKNTQTGRYRCGTCFDEYDEGKAVWR